MKKPRRYPNLALQSKNELAKRLSHRRLSREEANRLIDNVSLNQENFYRDSRHSQPTKGKFVRDAKGTPLGILLQKINEAVLAPHDHLLPPFIFGGIQNSNHLMAAEHLLGSRKRRTLLALDISRFFEQVGREKVYDFLRLKAGCHKRAASLISNICCVPEGPKGSGAIHKTLGRGFATSSRLAIWCNLDVFIALERLVRKRLKGHDPRISIYVDDIGITASRVSPEKISLLGDEIAALLDHHNLPENAKKRRITPHQKGMMHLGVELQRNKLKIGAKTRSNLDKSAVLYKSSSKASPGHKVKKRYKALKQYAARVNSVRH